MAQILRANGWPKFLVPGRNTASALGQLFKKEDSKKGGGEARAFLWPDIEKKALFIELESDKSDPEESNESGKELELY